MNADITISLRKKFNMKLKNSFGTILDTSDHRL